MKSNFKLLVFVVLGLILCSWLMSCRFKTREPKQEDSNKLEQSENQNQNLDDKKAQEKDNDIERINIPSKNYNLTVDSLKKKSEELEETLANLRTKIAKDTVTQTRLITCNVLRLHFIYKNHTEYNSEFNYILRKILSLKQKIVSCEEKYSSNQSGYYAQLRFSNSLDAQDKLLFLEPHYNRTSKEQFSLCDKSCWNDLPTQPEALSIETSRLGEEITRELKQIKIFEDAINLLEIAQSRLLTIEARLKGTDPQVISKCKPELDEVIEEIEEANRVASNVDIAIGKNEINQVLTICKNPYVSSSITHNEIDQIIRICETKPKVKEPELRKSPTLPDDELPGAEKAKFPSKPLPPIYDKRADMAKFPIPYKPKPRKD